MMETVELQIRRVIADIMRESTGIDGALLIDNNGFIIFSVGTISPVKEQELVSGVITSLANMAYKTGAQLDTGDIESVIVEGVERNILIKMVHKNSLVILASKDTPLGILFLAARKAIQKLEKLL